jgi:hypothetical protein
MASAYRSLPKSVAGNVGLRTDRDMSRCDVPRCRFGALWVRSVMLVKQEQTARWDELFALVEKAQGRQRTAEAADDRPSAEGSCRSGGKRGGLPLRFAGSARSTE